MSVRQKVSWWSVPTAKCPYGEVSSRLSLVKKKELIRMTTFSFNYRWHRTTNHGLFVVGVFFECWDAVKLCEKLSLILANIMSRVIVSNRLPLGKCIHYVFMVVVINQNMFDSAQLYKYHCSGQKKNLYVMIHEGVDFRTLANTAWVIDNRAFV